MSYHTEHDFADTVARYIRANGVVEWDELRQLIEREFELNDEDMVRLPGSAYPTRWQSQLNNLGANRTIIRNYSDIVRIHGGFATREFASELELPITDDGAGGVRTRHIVARRPQMTRENILKAISTQYLADKAKFRTEIRNHRETIINTVLAQRPSTEDVVNSLVAIEMNKFVIA